MARPVYIVDLFASIAAAVKAKGLACEYMYGHPIEINEALVQMTMLKSVAAKKFPLIALLTDFDEQRGENYGIDSVVNLHLIIANLSRKEWNAAQRMDLNFKPVLYPIYQELINQIARSMFFTESNIEKVKHTKTDRLLWGKAGIYGNNGLIFSDVLDCIEIRNLKLTVKRGICVPELIVVEAEEDEGS